MFRPICHKVLFYVVVFIIILYILACFQRRGKMGIDLDGWEVEMMLEELGGGKP